MEKRCLIISGGEYCPVGDYTESDYVIACDRGYEYAVRDKIKPDLALGDFDSYRGEVIGCEIHRCRPEKDDTDTMLAVKEALRMGFRHISLRCALGGRVDHLIANIQSLCYAAEHGAAADITDCNNFLTALMPGEHRVPRREGFSLSLFAPCGSCGGIDLYGVKYPLRGAELSGSFPLGVSNEWSSGEAVIRHRSGTLLLVMSRL